MATTFPCATCGTAVVRYPSQIALSKHRRFFCGFDCLGVFRNTGGYVDDDGYRIVTVCGAQVREHRYIASRILGRALLPSEDVHHVDGDKLNNRPENLRVLDKGAHTQEHRPLSWSVETAVALLGSGESAVQVAKSLGISHQALTQVLIHRGLYTFPNKEVAKRSEEIPLLWSQGQSAASIAEQIGVGIATVYKYISDRGLQRERRIVHRDYGRRATV